jgi:hypothetical protein
MSDLLDRVLREMVLERDAQKAIADEHQAIADAARAAQGRIDTAIAAIRAAPRKVG